MSLDITLVKAGKWWWKFTDTGRFFIAMGFAERPALHKRVIFFICVSVSLCKKHCWRTPFLTAVVVHALLSSIYRFSDANLNLYLRFSPEVLCSAMFFHVSGIVCQVKHTITCFHHVSFASYPFFTGLSQNSKPNPSNSSKQQLMVLICFSIFWLFLTHPHGFLGHQPWFPRWLVVLFYVL